VSRSVRSLLSGNEACVEGGLAAGVRFFAGYPISPATEISEGFSRRLPQVGGRFIQLEDELASMSAVMGASAGGVKAMTATSGPGFSLMQESIGMAGMIEIPCVIINVMRVGPASGIATMPAQSDVMQARWGTHGDHPVVVLAPSTVAECFDMVVQAVNISERFRVPVIVLSDAGLGYMREVVTLPDPEELKLWERPRPKDPPEAKTDHTFDADEGGVPPLADFGEGYSIKLEGHVHDYNGMSVTHDSELVEKHLHRLQDKLTKAINEITIFESTGVADAEALIIAYGPVGRSAKHAAAEARANGKKVGVLRLGTLWPFPDKLVAEAAENKSLILVPEMNLGQIVGEIERVTRGTGVPVKALNRNDGQSISPRAMLEAIAAASN
jgi:2-oxoglutarate ferredoxin oxidoreductase subunit alpha